MMRTAVAALAGALVLVALTAASASASGPVWVSCSKAVPKNSGAFTDKACSMESPSHEGSYELVEGIGKGKPFKGTAEDVEFEQLNEKFDFIIRCTKDKISGRYVAPDKVAGVVISMKRCMVQPEDVEKGCEVHTAPLTGRLGWIDQAKGEAGLELTSESEPETGVFTNITGCFEPHVTLTISGSVIVHLGPTGVLTKERTVSAVAGGTERVTKEGHCDNRENAPTAFEEEEASHVLVGEIPGLSPVVCNGAILSILPSFPMRIEKGEALMIR
jgi:hypothetical protein